MTTATGNVMDSLLSSFDSWKPNEVKSTGTGKATRGDGNTWTPEVSLEPDVARNLADQARRDAEAASSSQTKQSEPQQPDTQSIPIITVGDHGIEGEGEDEEKGGEQADVIKEVLKCGEGEHRKILGVQESYESAYEEEKMILDAVWERGTKAHPKYNKHKDAATAFRSKSILRPR
jgi:hypothetical protein